MTLRQYETTLVIDAHLSNEQIESSVEKYSKLITDNGGHIKLTDRWGKRRLAYEIKKKQYGYFVYIRFESGSEPVQLIEKQIRLDDAVIRHLTVLVPKAALAAEEAALKAERKEKKEAESAEAAEKAETKQSEAVKDETPEKASPETSEKEKQAEA